MYISLKSCEPNVEWRKRLIVMIINSVGWKVVVSKHPYDRFFGVYIMTFFYVSDMRSLCVEGRSFESPC